MGHTIHFYISGFRNCGRQNAKIIFFTVNWHTGLVCAVLWKGQVCTMKHFIRLLPAAVFIIMVFIIASAGILQKDRTYSSVENRNLQQMPGFSIKKVIKGKFQRKYEKYLADQFPARDSWIKLQTVTERLAGKTVSNGVYFGKEDYLLEKYTGQDFNKKNVNKNIKALEEFVRLSLKTADTRVMMVPSKTYTLRDYLPAFAETYDEGIFYKKIEKKLPAGVIVPVYDTLYKHRDEGIFYRTDHHWTTRGAWYGYCAYLESYGRSISIAEKKSKLKKVSDSFLGTTYSKTNIYSRKDEIDIYEPQNEVTVVYNLGEKQENTFYQAGFLKKKDKYSVFFGGNQAVLEISGGARNKKTLFVVKDSFANCLLPFLAEDYGRVVVVDMRHLNIGLPALLRKYKPSEVLVLYNTIQFMQDRDFALKN